jgi:glycerol-3-phosphate O-acyltransferase
VLSAHRDRFLRHFETSGWARREDDVWGATPSGEAVLACLAEQLRGVIEAYMACCSALAELDRGADENVDIDKRGLRKQAAQYFERSELLGEAARPEAANDTTFSNVLELFVERRILVENRGGSRRSSDVRYARGEEWHALAELRERLAGALGSR